MDGRRLVGIVFCGVEDFFMFTGGYTRPQVGRGVRTLLIVTVGVFLFEVLLNPSATLGSTKMTPLAPLFGLSLGGIQHGMIWQFFTYMFLHGSPLHLIANMFGLYFMGRSLEPVLGTKRFVQLYIISGVLGGLGWLLLSGWDNIPCVGASASVFAVICAFAAIFPQKKMTMLVYFVFPVTMTALTLVLILVGGSFFMMMVNKGNVAHTAHLAGAAVGWVYGRKFCGGSIWGVKPSQTGMRGKFGTKWSLSNLKAWYRRKQFTILSNDDDRSVNWAEVDAVLDKIKFRGVNGLTRDEKDLLDRASRVKR